jgi:hypothetical protein
MHVPTTVAAVNDTAAKHAAAPPHIHSSGESLQEMPLKQIKSE